MPTPALTANPMPPDQTITPPLRSRDRLGRMMDSATVRLVLLGEARRTGAIGAPWLRSGSSRSSRTGQ